MSSFKLKRAAILLLLLPKYFVRGLVEPTAFENFGSVAEHEFVDPSLSAINDSPSFLALDNLPALLNSVESLNLPMVDNPFGPSGTSLNDGLGLGNSGSGGSNGKQISVDARSGRVTSINLAKPILPGNGVGNSLLWSIDEFPNQNSGQHGGSSHGVPKSHKEMEEIGHAAIKDWFSQNQGLLEIDSKNELFQQGRTRMAVHGKNGETIQLSAQRTFKGLEVKGSRATATVKKGNLINVGLEQWGDIPKNFNIEPSITAEEAVGVLVKHTGREIVQEGKQENCKPELMVLALVESQDKDTAAISSESSVENNLFSQLRGGNSIFAAPARESSDAKSPANQSNKKSKKSEKKESYNHKLVWKICPIFQGQKHEIMEGYVDAHTLQIYSFKDTVDYLNNSRGNVYPLTNDGIQPDGISYSGWPMPYMDIGSTTTTTGGNYEGSGTMTGSFYGPYVNIVDNCGSHSLTQSGGLDWGTSEGTDCDTPGFGGAGNTHASRTGFYELNKMIEIARSRLPNNSWLNQRLRANMNINANCNAFWNGSTINFYTSGGGCANTGEIAAIFDHEWGHGMDANDVRGGIASPSGEGIADLYAALRLGDPCIGRGFRTSVCTNGGVCKTCTGVRTIDYMGRARERPYTLTEMKGQCSSSNVHCVGIVYAEAVWDLYKRFLQSEPYNYDDNTALEIVTRLTYIAAGNVGTWFSYNGSANSACGGNSGSAYYEYLAADDDNGNPNDGTPHMTAIWNAFSSHEIACANGPTVQDSGCTGKPTSAPLVTVQPGNTEVFISWTSVAGASEYEVLRTEGVHGCEQGKVLLANTDALSFTDVGLQNGRNYHYIVVPKGSSDSCYGPSSICKSASPIDGPSMSVSCPLDPVSFDPDVVPATNSRQCTVVGSNGWSGTVELGCNASGSFSGITCGVSTSSVSIDNNSVDITLDINAGSSTSVGEGVVELTADGGDTVRSFSVNVGVSKIPQMALYDASTGSPKCDSFGASCSSGTLLDGRGRVGPEPNYPNIIDGSNCDGNSGTYHDDESLDMLLVRSLDGDDMYEDSTVEIVATVWAWNTGSSDRLDLYYSNNPAQPNWQFIGTFVPPGGQSQEIFTQVQLLPGLEHIIRGNFRYGGSSSICSSGSWDDADDLVFTVKTSGTSSPVGTPTRSPSLMPSREPSIVPSLNPSSLPSSTPSDSFPPSAKPSGTSSNSPSGSLKPSSKPSSSPSLHPTFEPSAAPTLQPSLPPSVAPSITASDAPSSQPSSKPSLSPSATSSTTPSSGPSSKPSLSPSTTPSVSPSSKPTRQPTNAPTKAPTSTLPLADIGNNGGPGFPLGRCEGDCDSDEECEPGLMCFERSGTVPVPGCSGDGSSGTDYCIVRPSPNYLKISGNNGSPASNFPLGLCEGDCDGDFECAGDLVCFQRGGEEEVPGCVGLPGVSGSDYCYDPNYLDGPTLQPTSAKPTSMPTSNPTPLPTLNPTRAPTAVPTPDPTENPTSMPTSNPTPLPTLGPTRAPTAVPTLNPTENPTLNPTRAPTAVPTPDPTENPTSMPTSNPTTSPTVGPTRAPTAVPTLNPTENPSLSNLPSETSSNVPSLMPSLSPSLDPSSSFSSRPSLRPSGNPSNNPSAKPLTNPPTSSSVPLLDVGNDGNPSSRFPLGRCEGDCDDHDECQDGLRCFQRSGEEAVPGCTGTGSDGTDYCAKGPSDNYLFKSGNNGSPSISFPLGLCEGDCDDDDECAEGLYCFQRSGNEAVPGCDGVGTSGTDYCYDPNGRV